MTVVQLSETPAIEMWLTVRQTNPTYHSNASMNVLNHRWNYIADIINIMTIKSLIATPTISCTPAVTSTLAVWLHLYMYTRQPLATECNCVKSVSVDKCEGHEVDKKLMDWQTN